jgi:hypothetical protein
MAGSCLVRAIRISIPGGQPEGYLYLSAAPVRDPVTCPVCGFDSDDRVCGRCGTDLDALEGADGQPRLEIRPTHKPRHHVGSSSG